MEIIQTPVPNQLIAKLTADIRAVKINSILNDGYKFIPSAARLRKGKNLFFSQKYWPLIKEWKSKSVITGSSALFAFGLINRLPKDIDLLVDKSHFNPGRTLSNDRYPGMDGKIDVIGYYVDHNRGYNVDFFHNDSPNYIESDGYLFHHPYDIIEKKLKIFPQREKWSSKDISDIIEVLRKLDPEYKLF